MAELLLAASVGRQGSTAPDDDYEIEDFEQRKDDKRIKLKRAPGKPTDVYSWFEITLQEINLPAQTFKAVIEVHLFWQDYNLPNMIAEEEFDDFDLHDDYVPVKMSEIFENKVDCGVTGDPTFQYYKDTGTIYMMFVVDCTFVERMELQRFPLDRQFLNMEFNAMIEPAIETEGEWNWILEYPEWMPNELKKYNQTFAVRMLSSITEYELLEPWIDFSGQQPLSIRLRVNRLPAYYFGNIIFPNFLIVAGCFSAFVIPRGDIADRLSVTVTLMLAAVAYRFIVTQMLPKVSYLTIMDYYILLGFVSVMVLIAENAIAGVQSLDKYGAAIDLWCAILFGAMWLIVHIIALVALLRNECLRVSWTDMDKIDQEEDEEAEFIFAEDKFITGNNETEQSKSDWKKYQNYNVMDRANIYAKANNIKRTGTFVKKLKAEKKKVSMNLGKIYEEQLAKEKKEQEENNTNITDNTGENKHENIDIYVPSKLQKNENKIANEIELAEQKKDDQPKQPKLEPEPVVEKIPEPEPEPETEPKYEDKSENAPEVVETTVIETDEQKEENNGSADYVAVDKRDDDKKGDEDALINKDDTGHGYTQTVIVNNNVKDENDGNDEDTPLNNDNNEENNNEQTNEDYVQVNDSGYRD
eukprot:552228_1